jgi:hypothetical protein
LRPVIHGFAAAADGRKYTIDRDCTLVSVTATSGKAVVSQDGSSTIANCVTAPASAELKNVLLATASAGQYQLNFQLRRNEDIFISSGSAGSVGLLFDDVPITQSLL